MALLNEIENGHDCTVIISASNSHAQLSDGPEAELAAVKTVAESVFNIKTVICYTTDLNYKNEIIQLVDDLISTESFEVVTTGDLCHPDGIINDLRARLAKKYPQVIFSSIGEKYMDIGVFKVEQYLADVLEKLNITVISVRLPDFTNIEKQFLGQYLDKEHLDLLASKGIDRLGEDDEYQSLVASYTKGPKRLEIRDAVFQTERGRDSKNYDYLTQEITDWRIISA